MNAVVLRAIYHAETIPGAEFRAVVGGPRWTQHRLSLPNGATVSIGTGSEHYAGENVAELAAWHGPDDSREWVPMPTNDGDIFGWANAGDLDAIIARILA